MWVDQTLYPAWSDDTAFFCSDAERTPALPNISPRWPFEPELMRIVADSEQLA